MQLKTVFEKRKEKVKKMDGVKFQVLGFREFNRKSDNKRLTILTAISQCTPADNSRGAFGNKATDFFLPDDKVGTLTVECIGQEFIPEYSLGGFGKPVMSGFSLKPWK